jgi:hypothetical protein
VDVEEGCDNRSLQGKVHILRNIPAFGAARKGAIIPAQRRASGAIFEPPRHASKRYATPMAAIGISTMKVSRSSQRNRRRCHRLPPCQGNVALYIFFFFFRGNAMLNHSGKRWQRGPPIGKKGADGWPARAGCATTVIWRIRLASESHAARAAPWEGQQQISSSRATRRRAKARSSGAV